MQLLCLCTDIPPHDPIGSKKSMDRQTTGHNQNTLRRKYWTSMPSTPWNCKSRKQRWNHLWFTALHSWGNPWRLNGGAYSTTHERKVIEADYRTSNADRRDCISRRMALWIRHSQIRLTGRNQDASFHYWICLRTGIHVLADGWSVCWKRARCKSAAW